MNITKQIELRTAELKTLERIKDGLLDMKNVIMSEELVMVSDVARADEVINLVIKHIVDVKVHIIELNVHNRNQ